MRKFVLNNLALCMDRLWLSDPLPTFPILGEVTGVIAQHPAYGERGRAEGVEQKTNLSCGLLSELY